MAKPSRSEVPSLAELRREIDRTDESMHRLLMERGEIIDRLISVKQTQESGSAFRPAREAEMMRQTPLLVKLCSSQFVPKLVQKALPGMALSHLPNPPAAASPKVEYQYFAVNKAGPCWEHLVQTKRVGVYVPGEIPNPDLELLVVLDS